MLLISAALTAEARPIIDHFHLKLIQPGTTDTPFYEDLSFAPKDEPFAALTSNDVAKVIANTLQADQRAVFEEITLTPLKHAFDYKKKS